MSANHWISGFEGFTTGANEEDRLERTTRYLLDGLSVIAQYAPDGQRQAWYTQSLARIDEVLNVANESGKFWYQADALGSVYGLTNQAGVLIGSQSYDVFGAPTPAPTGPAGQPFGFTGREHELDSGLVYARDRYLSPNVGRWTQPDRLGFGAGPNFFGYVNGQPTRLVDPSGQLPFLMLPLFGAAIGGLFGFLGGLAQGGLSNAQLANEFISGAVFGAMSTVDVVSKLVPWISAPIITGAISNALFAVAANIAAQLIATGSVQSWPSVIISGLFAAGTTLLMGMNRFGLREAARLMTTEMQIPFTVRDMFTLIPSKGAGMFDFMLQAVFKPAFLQAEQAAKIEAMFNEDQIPCLTMG